MSTSARTVPSPHYHQGVGSGDVAVSARLPSGEDLASSPRSDLPPVVVRSRKKPSQGGQEEEEAKDQATSTATVIPRPISASNPPAVSKSRPPSGKKSPEADEGYFVVHQVDSSPSPPMVEDTSMGLQSTDFSSRLQSSNDSSREDSSRAAPEEKSAEDNGSQPPSTPPRRKPVVISRSSSKATMERKGAGATPIRGVRSNSASRLRQSASAAALQQSPLGINPAAVINWDFPTAADDGSPKRPKQQSGVFKQYFSPNQQNANSAYAVDNTAHSGSTMDMHPLVASPMAEFPLSPETSRRPKQLERSASAKKKQAEVRKIEQSRLDAGANFAKGIGFGEVDLSPSRGVALSQRGMGHSASAMSLPTTHASTSVSALGIAHQSPGAVAAARAAAAEYENRTGSTSFARRMIHAQSAAELYVPPPPPSSDPLPEDPDAASMFFADRSPQEQARKDADDANHVGPALGGKRFEERIADAASQPEEESTAIVPFHIEANPTGVGYPNYSRAAASYGARPQTAGVSSTGIAWSTTLTATLTDDAKKITPQKKVRPMTSSASGRKLPATLPPELTIGVEGMSPGMQREHAALAKMLKSLEPAGKGSLTSPSFFNKLGNSGRGALFSGAQQYYDDSQVHRVEQPTEADEWLRKRHHQKTVENQKQQSAALTSRGASGLAANNISAIDVARAVDHSNASYQIADERPRPSRPATAQPGYGLSAALAQVGSQASAEIIDRVNHGGFSGASPNKKRPGTSSSSRPVTSGSNRPATASTTRGRSEDLLLPGHNTASMTPPANVLGFGGAIDRFGSAVDDHRFTNTSTSHLGGRGMLATKSAAKLLASNVAQVGTQLSAVDNTPGTAKKFASLAIEFEVALAERLVRIPAVGHSAALERLDVFRTCLDSIILHSPHFGGLLAKVKAEYESYARAGAHTAASSAANPSPALRNQQQVEDTLVLENHRLNTKLHGFQRAYASLYAKYKSLLHTQKVQEGILSQNALVLADLNEQLQQSILSSMSDEEKKMEKLRQAGFKLPNETSEDIEDTQAKEEKKRIRATLPMDLDYNSEEDESLAVNEVERQAIHARKVARRKEAYKLAKQKENDGLEKGRQMMRDFKGGVDAPLPTVSLQYDADGDLIDQNGEAVLDADRIDSMLDGAPSAGGNRSAIDEREAAAARLARANPLDPSSMVSSDPDPLAFLQKQSSRKNIEAWQNQLKQMKDQMLTMQTQLEKSKAAEMSALMAVEEGAKVRYQLEKALRDSQAAAAATAASVLIPTKVQPQNSRSTSSIFNDPTAFAPHPVPQHALLDNIAGQRDSLSQSKPGSNRMSLNLPAPMAHPNDSDDADGQDDEDPDNVIASSGPSETDQVLAELRFQQQLSDSRVQQHDPDSVTLTESARREAAAVADGAMQEELAKQHQRRRSSQR